MSYLVVWLTVAMLLWCPPPKGLEGEETMRYAQIAWAALDVAFDPAERPLFDGPHGRAKTALQLLAIAGFESNYRVDVQMGKTRGKVGDACLMQIVLPHRIKLIPDACGAAACPAKGGGRYEWITKKDNEGLTAEDLVGSDPRMCFRVGLHMVRESFQICHDLSMYTNGKCNHDLKAQHREQRAKQYYKFHFAPITDSESKVQK